MSRVIHHISIDLETYSPVNLKKCGLYKYVENPGFEILLCAYSLDGGAVQVVDIAGGEDVPYWLTVAIFDQNYVKHAYNAVFEITCLSKFFNRSLPVNQWRCTMVHGLYCGYPAGLESIGKALRLDGGKQKLNSGKALIRYFCAPCKPTKTNGGRTRNFPRHDAEKWRLFKEYCAQDVVTEMEIARRLSAFPVPDMVQKEWETDFKINARGIAIDRDFVAGALQLAADDRERHLTEARELTGLDNPNSRAGLMKFLEENMSEKLPDIRRETVDERLKTGITSDIARRTLELRRELSKTSTRKYDAIAAALCADGRIRGLLQFYGANRTGRWAGRLVQVHNLPRTYVEPLDFARELVKSRNRDALKIIYGGLPETLSQLIRTALTATPGNTLIDADFSSIEARVVAWLAGEEWAIDVFRTHGKIYEATAAQLYGIPIEKIKKGNPEYKFRQFGKAATLALGYQGGIRALIKVGHLPDDTSEEILQDIVNRWRAANPRIRELWYAMENAAIKVVTQGGTAEVGRVVLSRELDYAMGADSMTALLPSGRKLYYVNPAVNLNALGKSAVSYMGVDQNRKTWRRIDTYGGKIVENCLSGDTEVFTDNGWKPLISVALTDRLWDGENWVSHGGVKQMGVKQTWVYHGVRCTPEHLFLTKGGWKNASQSERYNRENPRTFKGYRLLWLERANEFMARSLRLRERENINEKGFREEPKLRLFEKRVNQAKTHFSRYVEASDLRGVARSEMPLHQPETQSVAQLRRTRNNGLREMAEIFRAFWGGYGRILSARTGDRPNRRRRGISPGKQPLGTPHTKYAQQADERKGGGKNRRGNSKRLKHKPIHNLLPNVARRTHRSAPHKTGCYEPVYDILNAGENHRFTVRGDRTKPAVMVHNCVQSIARDCLSVGIERLESAGYEIVMHCHDEIVIDCPKNLANLAEVCAIMSRPITWAPNLPLAADGWVNAYYKKE